MSTLRFVGLDVHAETIAVCVAEAGGEVRPLGMIPNRPESIRKLIGKLGPVKQLRTCYEAGPTGYVVYWQLASLGVACDVVAPTLVPTKAGDRVKTDRRDAEKLARCHRAGELTAVCVPDAQQEALRDVIRAREAGKKDQLRARHRLGKFLLRHGRRPPEGVKAWTKKHLEWAKTAVQFEEFALQETLRDYVSEVEHAGDRIARLDGVIDEAVEKMPAEKRKIVEGLQAFRGISKTTAVTLVSEIGNFSRFEPRTLMGYSGLVPSERSSGKQTQRGSITKTGNAHLRRVIVEAAWAYRHRPAVHHGLLKRQRDLKVSEEVKQIAWKGQNRLHKRYQKLVMRGKHKNQVITAVGRELLGFLWAAAVEIEGGRKQPQRAA